MHDYISLFEAYQSCNEQQQAVIQQALHSLYGKQYQLKDALSAVEREGINSITGVLGYYLASEADVLAEATSDDADDEIRAFLAEEGEIGIDLGQGNRALRDLAGDTAEEVKAAFPELMPAILVDMQQRRAMESKEVHQGDHVPEVRPRPFDRRRR